MNVLTVISPGLRVLFERVGKPEIIIRPDFFGLGGTGAVIACNHIGWPMDGLFCVPATAALYVKARAFQSVAITMDLRAGRLHSD